MLLDQNAFFTLYAHADFGVKLECAWRKVGESEREEAWADPILRNKFESFGQRVESLIFLLTLIAI